MLFHLDLIIAVIIAYLVGSISSSILIAGYLKLPDPRTLGSGNPGATNMLRTGSKKAALLTLVGDLLKGLLPILIARWLQFDLSALCLMGLAAILGHMYPVYYKFSGGKGVATTLGVLLGVYWPLAITWIILWLGIAKLSGYSSLAALIATSALPVIAWLTNLPVAVIYLSIAVMLLVVWRHRSNIKNLITGQEDKIGDNN
ncbi:MAG: glycerol-3-phosphate 1-O-acyltransferase PlsY [Pseudomonadota bacterium]